VAAWSTIAVSSSRLSFAVSSLLVYSSSQSDLLRSVVPSIDAIGEAEPPRFTSRPPGPRTRSAAAAGAPNSGSRTRSAGPSQARDSRCVSVSTSSVSRRTTACAPARSARLAPSSERHAAMTRRAPRKFAICTATCPTTPPAPRTMTCSSQLRERLQLPARLARTAAPARRRRTCRWRTTRRAV